MINIKAFHNGLPIWININPKNGDTHLAICDCLLSNNAFKILSLTDLNYYSVDCKRLEDAQICKREEVIMYLEQHIQSTKEKIAQFQRIANYLKTVSDSCGLIKRFHKIIIKNPPTTEDLYFINELLFKETNQLLRYQTTLSDINIKRSDL